MDFNPTNPLPPADMARQSPEVKLGGGDKCNASGTQSATVLVRGETVTNRSAQSDTKAPSPAEQKVAAKKPRSETNLKLQGRLPALDDDADVGVPKDHVVVRDGKVDLAFNGTLLASAAPGLVPHDQWQELRVYETPAGKYVFSRVTRHLALDEEDEHEAEIFEPEPWSKSAQLLRNARNLARAHPLTWKDEAVEFFGYDALAKALYRKLGDGFEEHIS